jgi:hypothetical protein
MMDMRIKFNLHQHGLGSDPLEFGEILITEHGYNCYKYELRLVRGPGMLRTFRGEVRSQDDEELNHRTIIQLLMDIMIDLPTHNMTKDDVHVLHMLDGSLPREYREDPESPIPPGYEKKKKLEGKGHLGRKVT